MNLIDDQISKDNALFSDEELVAIMKRVRTWSRIIAITSLVSIAMITVSMVAYTFKDITWYRNNIIAQKIAAFVITLLYLTLPTLASERLLRTSKGIAKALMQDSKTEARYALKSLSSSFIFWGITVGITLLLMILGFVDEALN